MIYKFKLVGFVKKGFVQLQFYQYTTNTPVLSSFGDFSRLEFAEVHTEEVGCERNNLGALAHVSNLANNVVQMRPGWARDPSGLEFFGRTVSLAGRHPALSRSR